MSTGDRPADPALYARMVEQAPDGMLLTDARAANGPIIHANRAFEILTGYPCEQVLGRPLHFLLPAGEDQDLHQDLANCLVSDTTCTLNLQSLCADGSRLWTELTTVPLRDEAGQVSHYLGVLRDISQWVVLHEQVQTLEHELDFSSRELVKLATRDTLTTLYNRRYFLKRLEREWQRCLHEQYPLVLFNLAVDGFKRFNETHGTQAGDELLQRVAHILQTSFPRNTDVVARYGNVEFIASSDGMAPEAALSLAQDMAQRVGELPLRDVDGQPLGISIGLVSGRPATGLPPERFMVEVAHALVAARRQGGMRICQYELKDSG